MRTLGTVTAILGVVAIGSSMGGGETAPSAPRPAHRTATGRLAAYDVAARTLTLRSVIGLSSFRLAEDARVWLGRRRLSPERLGQHLEAQATVAWADVDGARVTHTVRLIEGDPSTRHQGE